MDSLGIALYGGSFDPPHDGHVHVALTALEHGLKAKEISELWVVPTFRNPLRGRMPIASPEERFAMVKRTFEPFKEIKVCDIELTELFACYTIDVVRRLREITPRPFRLILGSDCLNTLGSWKESEELLRLAPPYIVARSECARELVQGFNLPASTLQSVKDGWIKAPCLEISSTWIRARLKEGLPCAHLAPQAVLNYIKDHHLYQVDD